MRTNVLKTCQSIACRISWFNGATPAGPNDTQQLILGFWPDHPDYASSPVEWFEVRYYAMNTLTDQDMIKIRNEMKAQYA